MLKKIRIGLAWLFWIGITLLLLDITGILHGYLGWMAKLQFLPAVLALNLGVIVGLVLLTLVFGRVYCSVICPLGVFQDGISWLGTHKKKAPYKYKKEIKWLRYGVWALFIIALIAGVQVFVALLAPYSAYGRMVQNLLQPLYIWGNNLLAWFAERAGSYAFYPREVWIRSIPTFLVAIGTLIVIVILAWKGGRTYCNSICPVGTTLSFFSRFAMFRPVIDADKCKHCKACEHNCKAQCIAIGKDSAKIDYSRCVDCFNCLEECKFGALSYRFAWGGKTPGQAGSDGSVMPDNGQAGSDGSVMHDNGQAGSDGSVMHGNRQAGSDGPVMPDNDRASSRRAFLAGSAIAAGSLALKGIGAKAQRVKKVDGGFAEVLPKQAPERSVPITPPGSKSVKDFYRKCTGCQLCVAECPNNVLRPSTSLERLMQPEMSYEKGYCRPECTRCSELCPSGAICKITREEKTQYHIGTAHVNLESCLSATEKANCGKCSQVCPVGAIQMVESAGSNALIPTVAEEVCIGCGACEQLCPVRPVSAITVNGRHQHV
ncbi:MAG: 4Fe-4S dicluster domain-containing protein [Bacteroidales bacterium]|nr:4Fe-4S dicluster domain-containing protein [Bacteroidales bacterium]